MSAIYFADDVELDRVLPEAELVTVGGRVFTSVVMLIGLGIVAVPAGLLASAMSKARELEG